MSKEQKRIDIPSSSELPPPRVLWSGMTTRLGTGVPCRVVLIYNWTLESGADTYVVTSDYVLERADTKDAMGQPKYEKVPLTELPTAFFKDVLKAASERM